MLLCALPLFSRPTDLTHSPYHHSYTQPPPPPTHTCTTHNATHTCIQPTLSSSSGKDKKRSVLLSRQKALSPLCSLPSLHPFLFSRSSCKVMSDSRAPTQFACKLTVYREVWAAAPCPRLYTLLFLAHFFHPVHIHPSIPSRPFAAQVWCWVWSS